MNRLFNNLFKSNFDLRFISKLERIIDNYDWQIIHICSLKQWKKNHILYSTFINNNDFFATYLEKINKNKKILLFGNWRFNTAYFHFLLAKGYKVYLFKPKDK